MTTVDAAWLSANATTYGGPPYVLDTAGTYALATDVTVNDTAFVVGAAGVTLDLAGHTVTYDNRSPFAITNGGFETGTPGDTTAAGWDLTAASAAGPQVRPNTESGLSGVGVLWDNNVLRLNPPGLIAGTATMTATDGTATTITLTSHGLAVGREVSLLGFATSPALDLTVTYKVSSVVDANTFKVKQFWGGNATWSNVGSLTGSVGPVQRVKSTTSLTPVSGMVHAASVVPAGTKNSSSSSVFVLLDVVDETTGVPVVPPTTYPAYTPHTPGGGSEGVAPVKLWTGTANAVHLEVAVAPVVAAPGFCYLDRATVSRAYPYGVFNGNVGPNGNAGGTQDNGVGVVNFPAAVVSAWRSGTLTVTDSVGGGKLVQGQHLGYSARGIECNAQPGSTTVSGLSPTNRLTIEMSGDDAYAFLGKGGGGNTTSDARTVTNCTVNYRGPVNITDRYLLFAALEFKTFPGSITVQNCTLTNIPNCGISPGYSADGTVPTVPVAATLIDGNTCTGAKKAVNSYMIVIGGGGNMVVSNNTVTGDCRALAIDSSNSAIRGVEVFGNTFDTRETQDRQFFDTDVHKTIRIRNSSNSDPALSYAMWEVSVHDNVVTARNAAGEFLVATACRIGLLNPTTAGNSMAGKGPVFFNNTWKAFTETTDTNYTAQALLLDGLDAGILPSFDGETLRSNDTTLQVCGADGQNANTSWWLRTCGLAKAADGASAARTFFPVIVGNSYRLTSDVRLISCQVDTGSGPRALAGSDITWVNSGSFTGSPPYHQVYLGATLTVTVTNNGGPVTGASVTATDTASVAVDGSGGVTDVSGQVKLYLPLKKYEIDNATGTPVVGPTAMTPYDVTAAYSGLGTVSSSASPTGDSPLPLSFSGPPPQVLAVFTPSGNLMIRC